MQTRREYLITKGLAKPTRGKLSREALAEIERAIREDGMEFSDMQDRPVVVKRTPKERPKDANESVTEENRYAAAAMRYPADQMFEGTDSQGKKYKVSARNGCGDSHYSIAGCYTCPTTHTTLVNSMEFITVKPVGE